MRLNPRPPWGILGSVNVGGAHTDELVVSPEQNRCISPLIQNCQTDPENSFMKCGCGNKGVAYLIRGGFPPNF